jgi:transposase
MIHDDTRNTILTLHERDVPKRQISRMLGVSRNTVRQVLQGKAPRQEDEIPRSPAELAMITDAYAKCRGNAVRVQEILKEQETEIPYSTLTRLVREMGLRATETHRAGRYILGPGEEMQHDTSPHKLMLGERRVTAQCAALVLGYSRRLYIRYYPSFTRFEAKVFLSEAFRFMDGVCGRIVIDNTSVIVAHGSGPDAEIAPEMVQFCRIFGVHFVPHRINHPDRKARVERSFSYVERNFLAGRTFRDWEDLNDQALSWCRDVANKKPKRSLGMSPEEAYVMEKSHLKPLPPYIPPIYQTLYRIVDVEGYVRVDTNRYSVPERLIGKSVEVQKHSDTVVVVFDHKKVSQHRRLTDKKDTRVTDPGHHQPLLRLRSHKGPSPEEQALLGESEILDRYVAQVRKRSSGRGMVRLRRLLNLKRTYPHEAFLCAVTKALSYGLFDLTRLESLIIECVAGEFFRLDLD